jgi:sRNA-binding protein
MDRIDIPGRPGCAGLTDEERAELARKAAEATKRSEDNARAKRG